MLVEQSFDVASPVDTVFDTLKSVRDIGLCVAGVKSVDLIDERRSTWRIEQRLGFMSRSFTLAAEITELHRPDRIGFSAVDNDVTVTGAVNLAPNGNQSTQCKLQMEIEVSGALAPLVDLFAKGPQEALIRDTIANLRTKLEDTAGAGAPATPAQLTEPRRSIISRLRAWFRRRS